MNIALYFSIPALISKIQTAMILAIAFAEAIAIYVLVVALIVKFV